MLLFILMLLAVYFGWLIYEKRMNDLARASFRHVIYVNGIRGKTGVCRLTDAHLRKAGYRVFTKTTGSLPFYIDTDGNEHKIRRHGPANIHEQLKMVRKAWREKADILILECMAVQPELQRFTQDRMVRGDMNVITNVRYDHVFEMGESLEEIAESLANTIPENGVLFTSDRQFYPFFVKKAQEKGTEVVLCEGKTLGIAENEAIACAIGEKLGIPASAFSECWSVYREDFGAHKLYEKEGWCFLNLFSVNDPMSAKNILGQYVEDMENVTFLYNNRSDRPDRLLLFIRCFFPYVKYKRILVMGTAKKLACRLLRQNGIESVRMVSDWRTVFSEKETELFVGIGNIKGKASDIIRYLEEEEQYE